MAHELRIHEVDEQRTHVALCGHASTIPIVGAGCSSQPKYQRFASTRAKLVMGMIVGIWSMGLAWGAISSFRYETTPGPTGAVRDQWPDSTKCHLSRGRHTLLMFLHPRCFCSHASLSELAVLMANCPGLVDAQVLFLHPTSFAPDWSKTDMWQLASRIPNVELRADYDGAECQHFNANVSGEVFLFSPDGELEFHGGITPGRGHTGDNVGRTSIEAILKKHTFQQNSTPVYGCLLRSTAKMTQLESRTDKGASR